ncbi:MAG: hypothetical protein J5554_01615 [Paludibacteraceae bacterium]|nr:hypothetical protein [Paludibacteraceae bacterium]
MSQRKITYGAMINHLGNVLAVISDEASTADKPTIVSLSDYYPYGMTEPGRSYSTRDYLINMVDPVAGWWFGEIKILPAKEVLRGRSGL